MVTGAMKMGRCKSRVGSYNGKGTVTSIPGLDNEMVNTKIHSKTSNFDFICKLYRDRLQ
jgi:hypothetical protein